MAKVIEEGADLSGYVELRCTADGALCGSRLIELKRERDGEEAKLALEVADPPPTQRAGCLPVSQSVCKQG